MKSKRDARLRRAARTRRKIRELGVPRLCVYRTPQHIYAQIISADGSSVLASASTLDKANRTQIKYGGNIESAKMIGASIAKLGLDAGIKKVAFDRAGFQYHGRVKALAEAAREGGLDF